MFCPSTTTTRGTRWIGTTKNRWSSHGRLSPCNFAVPRADSPPTFAGIWNSNGTSTALFAAPSTGKLATSVPPIFTVTRSCSGPAEKFRTLTTPLIRAPSVTNGEVIFTAVTAAFVAVASSGRTTTRFTSAFFQVSSNTTFGSNFHPPSWSSVNR